MQDIPLPIPPPALQYHVFSREVSTQEFLDAGRGCAESLEIALARHGLETKQFKSVLDFGCGCARVLRHFAPLFGTVDFHGTDVASSVIEWDRANVAGVTFHRNDAKPPLPFSDGFFDYLWSISVFSHLPEDMALAWLSEFQRIVRVGGIALVTVHGRFRFDEECGFGRIPPNAAEEYEDRGFTYVHAFNDKVLPDWYQNAFMSESFVRRTFVRFFDVLDYIPQGMMGRQDIVLLRRTPA